MLNIAYNILAGGHCLDDLELLRNDEVYLDALGAQLLVQRGQNSSVLFVANQSE